MMPPKTDLEYAANAHTVSSLA